MGTEGIIVGGRSGPPLEGILADFSIDSAVLKPRHGKWLDINVVRKMRQAGSARPGGPSWRIHLYGLASHSGSDAHNLALSKRRAEAVRDHILAGIPAARIEVVIFPRGEANASAAWEGMLDRAVHLQMWQARPGDKRPTPPPIDIPPVPTKDDGSLEPGRMQRFRLRTEDFATGSLGPLGRLKMWMDLQDPDRKTHTYYLFSGSSVGLSGGLPYDLNESDPWSGDVGPWNAFSARGFKSMPLTTADFGGPASYNKLLIGGNSFRFGISDHGALASIAPFDSPDNGVLTVDVATTIQGTMTPLCEEISINEFRSYSGRIYG